MAPKIEIKKIVAVIGAVLALSVCSTTDSTSYIPRESVSTKRTYVNQEYPDFKDPWRSWKMVVEEKSAGGQNGKILHIISQLLMLKYAPD